MSAAIIGTLSLFAVSTMPAAGQTRDDCLMCHSDNELVTERDGVEVSLFVDEAVLNQSTHRRLVCVACHAGFNPEELPHKEEITPVNCMTCHKDAPTRHRFHPRMVEATGTDEDIDISCKGCHGTHDVISPKSPRSPFHVSHLIESCGECHSDVAEEFMQSSHAEALKSNQPGAPNCVSCHSNDIVPNGKEEDRARIKISQEKMCLTCHLDDPQVRSRMLPTAGFVQAYENSVHGGALQAGNGKAANCVDCHGSHSMRKGLDPASWVNKAHIPETCSQCHQSVYKEYAESIHGAAAARGNKDAPVCTDCHGEHNILRHTDPNSPVAATNVSSQVCSPCHSSVKFSEKYGLSSDRFKTFSDSFHGLATRAGSVEVANCASCHGNHDIKPSSDPSSSVNKANLAKTCGSCHPGANERFGLGEVHVALTSREEPLLYWVSTVYIILIITVVGGMGFHNIMDLVRKGRRKIMIRRGLMAEEPTGRGLYLRMTLSERLQHGSLMLSFIVLVITGFMLRYPDAWWVVSIRNLSDSAFALRGVIHRIAGVVMVLASLYHIYHVSATRRGRELIRDLFPRYQDAKDAISVLKYNLGLSGYKPKFDRFSYIEKSEYWALVWGTIVMAATGVILWFDNTFLGLLTKLGWDVARTIHFYEAWLATLSILVWHLYFVLFNPEVYPMNMAWLTGTLSESEMAEEHPLELERIKQKELEAGLESVGGNDKNEQNSRKDKTPKTKNADKPVS